MYLKESNAGRQPWLACASLSGLLILSACSSSHGISDQATPAPTPVDQSITPSAEPMTVTEAAASEAAEPEAPGTTTVLTDAGPELKAGAPRSYVVQRGDTLWGIANMFLRDPWFWPEIWYLNPDIHNPHLIYPGDTVRLAVRVDGRVALQLVSGPAGGVTRLEPLLRTTPTEGPIATIPYGVIGAFLSRPGVLTREQVTAAPYVLALNDEHQVAGTGNDLYVKKLDGEAGARYSVMHVDEPLKDPQSGRKLGYLAIYAATAQLTRPGQIAKMTLTDSARETLQGDVLIVPEVSSTSNFAPHPPSRPIDGRVIAVVDNVLLAGQYEVVALNRGSLDGLDRGSVLVVQQRGEHVSDRCARIEETSTCWIHSGVNLPDENSGRLLVFKTYERMSYALILNDINPINIYDPVRNP
jgi:LysM repeat protein